MNLRKDHYRNDRWCLGARIVSTNNRSGAMATHVAVAPLVTSVPRPSFGYLGACARQKPEASIPPRGGGLKRPLARLDEGLFSIFFARMPWKKRGLSMLALVLRTKYYHYERWITWLVCR